ncbi:MAG: hypothetical protein QXO55_06985 [Candidatus Korarchaeum sp.]
MRKFIPILILLFLPSTALPYEHSCYLLTLSDADSGRLIYSACLYDGECLTYDWKNSLYGLNVTEVFSVWNGSLVLMEIVYHDPHGNPEPLADPDDLEYLCHQGGPFRATNVSKAYAEISLMVGRVGKPRVSVRDRTVDLDSEVGFGGRVILRISRS